MFSHAGLNGFLCVKNDLRQAPLVQEALEELPPLKDESGHALRESDLRRAPLRGWARGDAPL